MSSKTPNSFGNNKEWYNRETKVVPIKYFYFESEARLYSARLQQAGIQNFISNANTATILAFGEGGIGLHIKEEDVSKARIIIDKLDSNTKKEHIEQSFHDADKEDIAYEKALHETPKILEPALLVVVIIILLLLLRAFLNGQAN